ncbi:hypothetical protein [Colwellia sp. Arc7-635]|uniref:hypothetical protein n=1 Tax=Colwellia sp. Arc7-635 TaxID=2497879 RepID=UPI0019D1EFC0|nr:hypothetical protein [Colwellia sp. Arc7-635]
MALQQYYLQMVKPISGNNQITQAKAFEPRKLLWLAWLHGYNAQQVVLSYMNM